MAFLRVLACTVLFSGALGIKFWARYEEQWEWLFIAKWAISSVNDLTITVTMLFLLSKQRNNVHTRYGFYWLYAPSASPLVTQNRGTHG
jgi:hypothetical protein